MNDKRGPSVPSSRVPVARFSNVKTYLLASEWCGYNGALSMTQYSGTGIIPAGIKGDGDREYNETRLGHLDARFGGELVRPSPANVVRVTARLLSRR